MNDKTRVDLLIHKFKNNRLFSYVIFFAIAFLALVSVGEGFKKAGELFGNAFISEQLTSTFDAETKEQLISIARDVDEFFLKIEKSSDDKVSMEEEFPFYIKVKADLRSVFLRNKIRPLNHEASNLIELALEQWNDVGKLLDTGINKDVARAVDDAMNQFFLTILTLEGTGEY